MPINFKERTHTRLLVIDPSSSHLAYSLITLDPITKVANFDYIGQLWTKDTWSRGKKFAYMMKAIQVLIDSSTDPSQVFTESFFMNFKQMNGSSTIPVINGIIELLASINDIQFEEFGPPVWRGVLGIKPVMTNGKKDYKVPTHTKVVQVVGQLPSQITSNITGKPRDLPNDVTDCLAFSIAVCQELGYSKTKLHEKCFNNESLLNKIRNLNE